MGFPTTPLLRNVLQSAQAEAFRRGQLVGLPHLILAIVRCPESDACKLIDQVTSANDLQSELLRLVEREPVHLEALPKRVPLSPVAKSAIEKSIADVMSRGTAWCTLDVVIGILRERNNSTADLLVRIGVTLQLAESHLSNTNGLDQTEVAQSLKPPAK